MIEAVEVESTEAPRGQWRERGRGVVLTENVDGSEDERNGDEAEAEGRDVGI